MLQIYVPYGVALVKLNLKFYEKRYDKRYGK